MNTATMWVLGVCVFWIGVMVGVMWNVSWVRRFRYEAEHWNRVVESWRSAYDSTHQHNKALRSEIVELHKRITSLTVQNCEVLEWVARNVKRAREENAKSLQHSTPSSSDSGSTTFTPSET